MLLSAAGRCERVSLSLADWLNGIYGDSYPLAERALTPLSIFSGFGLSLLQRLDGLDLLNSITL